MSAFFVTSLLWDERTSLPLTATFVLEPTISTFGISILPFARRSAADFKVQELRISSLACFPQRSQGPNGFMEIHKRLAKILKHAYLDV